MAQLVLKVALFKRGGEAAVLMSRQYQRSGVFVTINSDLPGGSDEELFNLLNLGSIICNVGIMSRTA